MEIKRTSGWGVSRRAPTCSPIIRRARPLDWANPVRRANLVRRAGMVLLALALLALGAGCASQEPTPTPDFQDQYTPTVSVTGELLPATWAVLSSKAGGTVAEVRVEPGTQVAAGDLLVRLETVDLEIALHVAQQQAAAQRAALEQILQGATDEVIARADRDHAYQVVQAEAALQVKRRQLAQAQAQDPDKDAAVAAARLEQLNRQLAQLRAQDPAPTLASAQIALERAQIALDDTQDEYNKALDRPWEDQAIRDTWADRLEQVQLDYRLAQAQVDGALKAQRAHALSLGVMEAQIVEAETMLAQAQDAKAAHQIALQVLQDEIDAAQAQLELLVQWDNPYRDRATGPEIAQAEALAQAAQWSVAQIEQQIADAELRAPFDATIGAVDVHRGEMISPGQPLVTLGDLGALRVETTDLDEIDVARVAIGQPAAVTFDALPERVFAGRVTRISPMSEPGSGGVHYTAIVELDPGLEGGLDPALRWGMTAFVDIQVDK
jgi:HlyD family secretion protein